MNNHNLPTISILGCGWYGFPLGKKLISLGFPVKGSTTDHSKLEILKLAGIAPFFVQIPATETVPFPVEFLESDILILNIPPERREDIEDFYLAQMQTLLSQIKKSKLKEIIFISSTSVYPECAISTNEDSPVSPDKPSGKALLKAENLFQNEKHLKVLILRFAGLFGADRNPGRFLAEKRNLKDGYAPVNLVHLDDCIEITVRFLKKKCYGEIFNVCADQHPLRKDFYQKAALQLGLKPPEFLLTEENKLYKQISSTKLKKALDDYQFIVPDPMQAISK